MNVGVAHSEVNPNTRVMNSRGIWLTYLLLTVVLHIILLSIPFFTVPLVWTLTNVIHNLVSYTCSFWFILPWEVLIYVICSTCIKCRNKSLLVIRASEQILKKADNFKTTLSSCSLGVCLSLCGLSCRWCTCFYTQWRELPLRLRTKARHVCSHTGNRWTTASSSLLHGNSSQSLL